MMIIYSFVVARLVFRRSSSAARTSERSQHPQECPKGDARGINNDHPYRRSYPVFALLLAYFVFLDHIRHPCSRCALRPVRMYIVRVTEHPARQSLRTVYTCRLSKYVVKNSFSGIDVIENLTGKTSFENKKILTKTTFYFCETTQFLPRTVQPFETDRWGRTEIVSKMSSRTSRSSSEKCNKMLRRHE